MIEKLSVLKIDVEPKQLLIASEPYVLFTNRGYQAVVNVIERKSRREFFIYLGAQSLADTLEKMRLINSGKMLGLEFWVRKKDSSKFAGYVIEE
jgi:hypothetical protein